MPHPFITDIPVDRFAFCPVCQNNFTQPVAGRRRKYCSAACKHKEFRLEKSRKNETKLPAVDRAAESKRLMATGDWRYLEMWPGWCCYRCQVCGGEISELTPAWVDRESWQQVKGLYRRLICADCAGPPRPVT